MPYNSVLELKEIPQKRIECFRLLLEHLALIEHQFLGGIRDSKKAGILWRMMRGVGGVRESINHSWLAKGLWLLCWGFKGVQEIFHRKRPALFKSGQWYFQQDNTPISNIILVTENLTRMGIKTVTGLPYSPDLAPCDFWFFPKVRGCRYETIQEMKEAVTKVIHTRGLPLGFPEVFGMAQGHCSCKRLLRRGV